nr:class I SAM-dependent methyltransferase [Kofleriaceae bacterium]
MAEPGLAITALYTSQVWARAGLAGAELFETADARRVYAVTTAALAVMRRGRAPLATTLLHRHLMIDHLARDATRIVEVAAGLSRRGAARTADPACRYVEVDLPHVVAHKRALLERSPAGRAVLARSNYQLVAGDATAIELAPHAPDLVIAEGFAMYLDGPARRRWLASVAALPRARLVFDLVPDADEPPRGLSGRVLEAAMKRFTGGASFHRDARTRADVLGELRDAGFTDAVAYHAGDVARAWDLPRAEVDTPMVVFAARHA